MRFVEGNAPSIRAQLSLSATRDCVWLRWFAWNTANVPIKATTRNPTSPVTASRSRRTERRSCTLISYGERVPS